jgi:hypothetical protein
MVRQADIIDAALGGNFLQISNRRLKKSSHRLLNRCDFLSRYLDVFGINTVRDVRALTLEIPMPVNSLHFGVRLSMF